MEAVYMSKSLWNAVVAVWVITVVAIVAVVIKRFTRARIVLSDGMR